MTSTTGLKKRVIRFLRCEKEVSEVLEEKFSRVDIDMLIHTFSFLRAAVSMSTNFAWRRSRRPYHQGQ